MKEHVLQEHSARISVRQHVDESNDWNDKVVEHHEKVQNSKARPDFRQVFPGEILGVESRQKVDEFSNSVPLQVEDVSQEQSGRGHVERCQVHIPLSESCVGVDHGYKHEENEEGQQMEQDLWHSPEHRSQLSISCRLSGDGYAEVVEREEYWLQRCKNVGAGSSYF